MPVTFTQSSHLAYHTNLLCINLMTEKIPLLSLGQGTLTNKLVPKPRDIAGSFGTAC